MQCQQIPDTSWPHLSRNASRYVCTRVHSKREGAVVGKSTEKDIAATISAGSNSVQSLPVLSKLQTTEKLAKIPQSKLPLI